MERSKPALVALAVFAHTKWLHKLVDLEDNDCKTIAFPAISCGVYGFPIAEACNIAMREVCEFLDKNNAITAVYFSCFSNEIENEFRRVKRQWENLL